MRRLSSLLRCVMSEMKAITMGVPFQADRRHFSHRLVEHGLTPVQAVRTIDLVTLAGGLGALLLHRLNAVGACVVVSQTVCLLGVVALLELSATRPGPAHVEAKPDPPPLPSPECVP